jgi:uncharacterized protein
MEILKSLWGGPLSLLAVLLILALLLRLLENRMTFFPSAELSEHPDNYGLAHEELMIEVAEGGTVHGWHFPAAEQNAPVLVIFHGNAGNISHRLDWLAPFLRRGLGALLFDYRGYGKSTGRPSEKNFQQDALIIWDYLTKTKKLPCGSLILFGRSIGSAPAAYLAANRPVGGLIMEGAFFRGADMARQIFGFLPVQLIMKNRWEVAEALSKTQVPVLITHGTEDEVVPFKLGKKLAETKGPDDLEWWPVSGGRHLDLHILQGANYYDRMEKFARRAVGSGGR